MSLSKTSLSAPQFIHFPALEMGHVSFAWVVGLNLHTSMAAAMAVTAAIFQSRV